MRRFYPALLARTRSLLLSFATVVPLLIVVLGLAACVKHPVGDPENSKMDPQYSGVWLTESAEGEGSFLVMRPYDARTYFASIMSYRKKEGGIEPTAQLNCKAWLTPIGDATFVTMAPLSSAHFAGISDKPPYLVGKLRLIDGALHLRLVNGGGEPAQRANSSRELEATIAKHVASDSLYVEQPEVFKKADDKTLIESVLKAFHYQD